ncbi:MAG: response regulator [candidate division Zixibacteria bacterium]|nr:response regulator [candidate division Zixibacteria bacterium]
MKKKFTEKVLIADAEMRMCESLSALLNNSGYEVETACDGERALSLINQNNFDLVITDINLPKVNGLELLRRIKSIDKEAMVIIMSGFGSLDTALQVIENGAYYYFLKPIDFKNLERVVKKGLEKRKLDLERASSLRELNQKNEELNKRIEELNALYQAGMSLSSTDTLDVLLSNILSLSAKVIGARTGSVMLLDSSEKFLTIKSAIGLSKEVVESTKLEMGKSIAGYVAEKGQPLLVEDVEIDQRFKRVSREKYETKSLLSVPLKVKDKVLGVINLNNKLSGEAFNSRDLKLISTFASQVAIAIDDAYNFEQSRKRITQLSVLHQIAAQLSNLDDFEGISRFIFEQLRRIIPIDFSIWFDWDEKNQRIKLSSLQGLGDQISALEIPILDLDIFDREKLSKKIKKKLESEAVISKRCRFYSFPILAEGAFHGILCAGNLNDQALTREEEEIIFIIGSQASSIYERQRAILNATRLVTMGNMMSEITHDLKKPLTSLKGVIQILKEGKSEIKQKELMNILDEEINRASELVRELADFSNPGKYQLERRSVLPVLEKTLKLLETDIKNNRIKVTREYQEGLPPVYINDNELLEALVNVTLNAIQSMQKGGDLKVELSRYYNEQREESYIKIDITDKGTGIPKENLNKIFDRYFTTKEGGSGLGLPIVERIIKAHNGFCEVDSQLKKGTKFSIYIPCS